MGIFGIGNSHDDEDTHSTGSVWSVDGHYDTHTITEPDGSSVTGYGRDEQEAADNARGAHDSR